MRQGDGGSKPRRFPIATVMLLLIAMMSVISKCQSKNDSVQAVQEEVTIERAMTPVFTSTPRWSGKVEEVLHTKCGDIRAFNSSSWEIDIALFEEIMDRECDAEFVHKLELRIFNERYAVRSQRPGGFYLSNVEVPGAEAGVTISSPYQVLSVIPTGSYDGDKMIFSGEPCNTLDVEGTTAELLTALVGHELIVHGRLRATGVDRYPDEECFAQRFTAKLHAELSGRAGFRRK